jgi:nucleotide-binding universal stress UspA family protein
MAIAYPYSRILLATELTEFDVGAERIAFAMAQRCGVPLRVVIPILSNPEFEAEMPDLALRAEREVARRIESFRQRATSAGVTLDIRVRRGDSPHPEIVAEAREAQSDLIVARRRGKPSFLAKLLVGEMVSKVVRDVSCSVLLVPRAAQFWNHGIVAEIGGSETAQKIASIAGTIAGICGLPLTILSVVEDSAARDQAQDLNKLAVGIASTLAERTSGRVAVGRPVEETVAAVRETTADLVIIGRQRYHLFPFGKAGIMQHIVAATDVPTLIVPE